MGAGPISGSVRFVNVFSSLRTNGAGLLWSTTLPPMLNSSGQTGWRTPLCTDNNTPPGYKKSNSVLRVHISECVAGSRELQSSYHLLDCFFRSGLGWSGHKYLVQKKVASAKLDFLRKLIGCSKSSIGFLTFVCNCILPWNSNRKLIKRLASSLLVLG
jgi:hypothetical protein